MSENENIPCREDIDLHGSLDEQTAARNFEGKSLNEAEALFRENSLYYQEDLMWMGPVAFRFYVQAAIACVESTHAIGDSDMVSCLASIFSFRCENNVDGMAPCAALLSAFCRRVIQQFERCDADPEFYPGLREQYQQLAERFLLIAGSTDGASLSKQF